MTAEDMAARDFSKRLSEDELHDPDFLGRWLKKIDAFATSITERSECIATAREYKLLSADLTQLVEILATLFTARATWAAGSETSLVETINTTIQTGVAALNKSFPRLATWSEPPKEVRG